MLSLIDSAQVSLKKNSSTEKLYLFIKDNISINPNYLTIWTISLRKMIIKYRKHSQYSLKQKRLLLDVFWFSQKLLKDKYQKLIMLGS